MHREKKYLLSLYNALNGTDYQDEDEIMVVTLKDAICISMKNDAAYVLHSVLNLYEQQSTPNPNMPLRELFYVAEEFRGMVDGKDLYKSKMVRIPEPRFVTFYNGETEQPAIQNLRLSDMYERYVDEPELELKVTVININPGYNDGLVASCESLSGYMAFVCKVRDNIKKDMDIDEAVRMAVDGCIEEDIMADFFNEHREEVVGASIWEFNQELNDQAKYEDGYDDGYDNGYDNGRKEGILSLIDKVCKKLKKGLSVSEISEALEESISETEKIVKAAQHFAPEYPADKIYGFIKQMP